MSDCKCETKLCVCCDVKDCIHHTVDNMCAAGRIQVGRCDSSSCNETYCDTFKAK